MRNKYFSREKMKYTFEYLKEILCKHVNGNATFILESHIFFKILNKEKCFLLFVYL